MNGSGATFLLEALAGRFDRWWWSPGLDPEAVGDAIRQELRPPGRVRHGGRERTQAVVELDSQPYPVRFRWELDGELALVELSEPAVDPSWPAVLAALGEPDVVFEHGRGPVPGGDQRCHLSRGLTVFDSGDLGFQAVWLYPPMPADEYPERTGAFDPIQRAR
jgi:hypothetical protein